MNAVKLLFVELEHLPARQNRLACTDVIVEMCKIVENPVTWQIDHRRRAAIDHVIIRQKGVHQVPGVFEAMALKQWDRAGAEFPKW